VSSLLPFIVIGIATGSIYGLSATGLAISYKTSGIFNFAFGAMAAMAVFIFYWLHDQNGMAWPLAAVICVFILGPVMGLLLELLARRLQRADHTLQIAATIGLVLWIVGIGNVWLGNVSQGFPEFLPISTVHLFGVNIEWEQIIVVIISLAGSIALYVFLQYVRRGRAMRAVVDDPELVGSIGESPVAVRRWAWVISSTFAAAAGLLIAPNLSLDATTLTLLVVQAFGAAAIGYFSNLPLVYVGGLLLGILGALATKYTSAVSWLVDLPTGLPFIVLIIVLVALPRAKLTLRRFTVPISVPPSWQAPPRLRIGGGVVFVALLCAVPALVGTKLTDYGSGLTLVILLLSLGLLVRTSRQVSLCQYAFAAIGAAAMGHFTSGYHIPWLAALLLAGLVAVPIGAIVAIPAIRLSGVFLALATYGFGILLQQVFYPQAYMFGLGGTGVATREPDINIGPIHTGTATGFYFVVLAVTIVVAIVVIVVSESRMGRLLRALGDSPLALQSYGLSVNVTRVLVFCLSAYIAAISGAMSASLFHFAIGTSFQSFSSLTLIALIVIVVAGDPWYAVIGAAGLTLFPAYISSTNVINYLNVVFGLGAVFTPAFRDKITGTPQSVRRLAERLAAWPRQPAVVAAAADGSRPSLGSAGGIEPVLVRAPSGGNGATPPIREGLVVKNLSVRFGGALAVNDVSLSATLGTITGLIGPNGAGKTTIFNACSGLVKPSGGRIFLSGQDVSSMSPAARARNGLGRTFQRVQLFESLDVRTNIKLARECTIAGANPYRHLVPRPRDERTITGSAMSAIELVGVGSYLDTPVRQLSTGQRRYVELARVLAGPFHMVLLDEPSSGLDAQETERLGEILVTIVRERGVGLLLVEHDMSLVRQVCSNIYVLDFGNLVFEGTPVDMAQSEVVKAAYLGSEDESVVTRAEPGGVVTIEELT
jgi:ABC-type branched-subunit amino acid transport system ATPase component/branched-subunit amino acid ABC-type transport system permease component